MSLYNQQYQGYLQPSYPPQPPPQFYAPQYDQYDPAVFRAFYRSQLGALTINSRPVIQHLSGLAMENVTRMGIVVGQCIEDYIRSVPPHIKLPAFYLLDSIAKNCFAYVPVFAAFVKDVFLSSIRVVDPPTRQKMLEMLVTWRTGGPNGSSLFGAQIQSAIEREVWPGSADTFAGSSNGPSYPTQSQVLTELEVTLAHKEKAAQDFPLDSVISGQVDALYQLRNLVQTASVSPKELGDILVHLRSLARTAAGPPPPQPSPPQPVPATFSFSVPVPQYAHPSAPVTMEPASFSLPLAPAPVANTNAIPDISNLFKSLVAAGLVSADVAQPAAQPPIVEPLPVPKIEIENAKENTPPVAVDHDLEATLEYERTILAMDVKLTGADIMKEHPQIVSLLYDRQTTQCKQCGLRFHDNAKGKKRYQDHLDQHFRQNTRANQQVGRGFSRSWFVEANDWIYNSVDEPGVDRPRTLQGGSNQAAQKRKELESSYVVIPPGEDTKPRFCPICKEQLKTEFLEDEEEWVWKNAVEHKDVIYHATCHADALSGTLANRLRSEMRGSRAGTPERRSGTPQPQTGAIKSEAGTPSTSSIAKTDVVAGAKRKAEDDRVAVEVKVKQEEDLEPPSKRARPSP